MDSEFDQYSPEKELASLPRDYMLEMALRNNDVVSDIRRTYNTDRFYKFLDNVNNGMPDKIRITQFGIDGPPTISILQFDGNIIREFTDATRFQVNQYYDNYGYQIVSQTRKWYGEELEDYFLITVDNKPRIIFTIF